jgi:hypothetical protein
LFGETFSHAAAFTAALKQEAPAVRVHAWIGLPVMPRPGTFGSGYVDLADGAVRRVVGEFAARVLREGEFDGIHLDPEPIADGDAALLALLQETHGAIGPAAILSIATPHIRPVLADAPLPAVGPVNWSAAYYRAVAGWVDQIALMTYDSMLPHPALYRQWARFQVITIGRALDGTGTDLLIGVPVSRERTATHRPEAESMASGLLGTIDGLNDGATPARAVTGVAIYPF